METLSKYKLAIFYVCAYTLNSLATCFVAAFAAVDWDELSGTARAVVIGGMIANWSSMMLAFFNRTLSNLEPKSVNSVGNQKVSE